MESLADQHPTAWHPLTPQGVGTFAGASFGRLFLVQSVVALLVAGTVTWFLSVAWFPMVTAAVEHLPREGKISSGQLDWTGDSPRVLAENRFLALAVDLEHAAQARSPAHLQVEFGRADVRFYSLFGLLALAYPKNYLVEFNWPELKPWWGARAPIFLGIAAAGTMLALMFTWGTLATLYCLPVWLIGLYGNRQLSLPGSWRLAGAALMPGALLMTAAIFGYGFGQLDVVRLLAAFALHIIVGWVYLVLGALATPKVLASSLKINPFKNPDSIPKPNLPGPPPPPNPVDPVSPVSPRGD